MAHRLEQNSKQSAETLKALYVQANAEQEFLEATEWYRITSFEVAERFVVSVSQAFDLIERFPASGACPPFINKKTIRRLPVRNFPYHVVFEEFDDRIKVFGCGSR